MHFSLKSQWKRLFRQSHKPKRRRSSVARLPTLPEELLLEILERLDDEDLYHLSLTCHTLHRLSLSTFLVRNDIPDPATTSLFTATRETHPLALTVIGAALWIQNLQQVNIQMSSGTRRLIKDVRTLKRIVGRVGSIKGLRLDFHSLDSWRSTTQMDKDRWVGDLTSLIDLAIDRGCYELDILGGDAINKLYIERERSGIPPIPVKFIPIQDGSGEISNNYAIPLRRLPKPNLRLQKLTIESTMLFQYSFYSWTIDTLFSISSTLTKLSLHCATLSCPEWSHLLASLRLPLLRTFELSTALNKDRDTQLPPFVDLLHFFERHRSLENLNLQAVELPEPTPILRKSILPDLKSVMANSAWIHCLLKLSTDHPGALPKLTSIGVTTEYFIFEEPDDLSRTYGLIDAAFDELQHFPRPIDLTLCLRSEKGMEEWFERHIALGARSVLTALNCVTTLHISTANCHMIDEPKRKQLPGWMALFPALTHLEFEAGWVGKQVLEDEEFLEKLAQQCPTLQNAMSVYGPNVDMSELRLRMAADDS